MLFVVPGPPSGLHAEVSQSESNTVQTVNVRLTWKSPTHVNGIIRSYEISLSTNSNLPDHLRTNIVSNGIVTVVYITPAYYYIIFIFLYVFLKIVCFNILYYF